jgi:hypothetical protein
MRRASTITTIPTIIIALSAIQPTFAAQLNSAADCVVGQRVTTKDGQKGKITRVDRAWSYCYVLQDDNGKEVGYLYSLLETAAPTTDKLVIGNYNCWVGGEAAASGMRLTSASTYESDGKKGAYHLEPSGKIVFESGPFSGFNAKLLSGQRIGMNQSGGTFYNLTCDLVK